MRFFLCLGSWLLIWGSVAWAGEKPDYEGVLASLQQLSASPEPPTRGQIQGAIKRAEGLDDLVADPNWARLKGRKLACLLEAIALAEAGLDPHFDPNKVPRANMAPPAETGLPSGVAPEAIADPALRKKYEAALAENAQYAAYFSGQIQARATLASILNDTKLYLSSYYRGKEREEAGGIILARFPRDGSMGWVREKLLP